MKTACSKLAWTISLMSVSLAALAGESGSASPHEPAGFVMGGVIGGFAAGPVGAVVGAGVGTWLGSRVHKAAEAKKAEAQVAVLQSDQRQLRIENATLITEKGDLLTSNRALTAQLDKVSSKVDEVQASEAQSADLKALDGLQGEIMFRTGSAEITPEMTSSLKVLAEAVANSPGLQIRLDGFADSRGDSQSNLQLSAGRADAVRDLFLAAGVQESALEVNAYGSSLSEARDTDGYALERRVRLTLKMRDAASVAQNTGPQGGNVKDAASQ